MNEQKSFFRQCLESSIPLVRAFEYRNTNTIESKAIALADFLRLAGLVLIAGLLLSHQPRLIFMACEFFIAGEIATSAFIGATARSIDSKRKTLTD